MAVLEFNVGSANTLPGPIDQIVCQSGQVIVVDHTTEPSTTTTLNTDDTFDAEGKAGLQIIDVDGSRIWTEGSLENRTDSQMVDTAGTAEQLTDVHGEPREEEEAEPAEAKETGSFESRSKSSLFALAQERDLDVHSNDTKQEIIDALRGE